MKVLAFLGRIFYALPFGVFGINHLRHAKQMAGIVPAIIPAPVFWVYFTGAGLIISCIFILFKIRHADFIAMLLALMLLSFIALIHIPGMVSGDPQRAMMAMGSLLKDTSLMGGALTYAVILARKK